jgi:hypothetical protein
MSVAAGHDQICALALNEMQEFGADRPSRLPPHLARHANSMAAKVACDIGKISFGGFRSAFVDSEDDNIFRSLQKRKGIAHSASTLARVLPCHYDAAQLERTDDIGHNQDRPACTQQDHAWIDKIMHAASGVSRSGDDEVRGTRLPQYEFVGQLKRGAPFNLFEMLRLGAESPAHVIETCAYRAALMLRGLVIDDNASGRESGPQRQAGNTNERCLKALGQTKGELNPLLAVARDVDVNHHGCERGLLVQSTAIENGPFRLNHGHERCSASLPPAAVPRATYRTMEEAEF